MTTEGQNDQVFYDSEYNRFLAHYTEQRSNELKEPPEERAHRDATRELGRRRSRRTIDRYIGVLTSAHVGITQEMREQRTKEDLVQVLKKQYHSLPAAITLLENMTNP